MLIDAPPRPPRQDDSAPNPWPKRLAIGLPVVVFLLIVVVANQIGSIRVARDLRADYEDLLARAEEAAAPAAEPAAPATGGPPAERPAVTVAATLTEFAIEFDTAEIPAWAEVTIEVTNEGEIAHDLAVGDQATPMLEPGESATLVVEAPGSGELELICRVAGHEPAGMSATLPIVGGDEEAPAAAAAPAGADHSEHQAASPDNADAYTGDKPALERVSPNAPPVLSGGTVHELELVVEEKVMQVAEDVWQEVWTFNGSVPAPTLRVKLGDTVRITLRNPETSGLGHSIDFHASQVAWNDEMRTIAPGEELVYEFKAERAGMFMYHCGTAPALHHIGNGMYGAIIVEPEGGLPDVDHEFVFVQGEYYLGPQGEPGDYEKMAVGAPSPDLVVFNGVAGQYADAPIEVGVGERIRTWVLNAGPSTDSSFHVVGTIFDTVVKEGVALTPDNPGRWGSQAVDLAPAQGGYAEFTLAEDGLYPIVSHAFNQPGLGAMGLFKAGHGGEPVAGGH